MKTKGAHNGHKRGSPSCTAFGAGREGEEPPPSGAPLHERLGAPGHQSGCYGGPRP
eukprot:CAMPEP_0204588274 /NCGR_PEP_ID=MMETSP0661-20131031/48531_1 /ASSEMBLY_ACC=CAM_ASM_000606 /TAXON_ID=109239 /ORGANISM="Alexandrium margalefi, Strain AMGDE01CS-322" /LENGTH=55 /DNA_ID=CAMNT_0051598075 /DNA_START=30 /DNA_END=197 /DNA_ORIENTATION=-